MSRPRLKNNKLSYTMRFISLVYLIPMLILCGLTESIKWVFINLDKITSYLFYKPMDIISNIFPFKGDDDE